MADSHFGLVGLPAARHCVAHTGAGVGVHVLDDDEGPLLQGGHRQVPVVRQGLLEVAIAWPDGVPHLENAPFKAPYLMALKEKKIMKGNTKALL